MSDEEDNDLGNDEQGTEKGLLARENELGALSRRANVVEEEALPSELLRAVLIIITVLGLSIGPGQHENAAGVAIV